MTQETKEIIIKMRCEGATFEAIGKVLGISRGTIHSFYRRHDNVPKPKGRPKKAKEPEIKRPREQTCMQLSEKQISNTEKKNIAAIKEFENIQPGQQLNFTYGKEDNRQVNKDTMYALRVRQGMVIQKTSSQIIVQDINRPWNKSGITLNELISQSVKVG